MEWQPSKTVVLRFFFANFFLLLNKFTCTTWKNRLNRWIPVCDQSICEKKISKAQSPLSSSSRSMERKRKLSFRRLNRWVMINITPKICERVNFPIADINSRLLSLVVWLFVVRRTLIVIRMIFCISSLFFGRVLSDGFPSRFCFIFYPLIFFFQNLSQKINWKKKLKT